MPILEVTIVLNEGELLATDLAAQIADAASVVFGSSPGGTWVRLATLDPQLYAEDSGGPPEGVAPVFVSVLKAEFQATEALQQEAKRLTAVVAAATSRPPQNVHIIYEPPAKGRISFGGRLRT
ncbi:MAG TPA: hypothetical protein VJL34_09315 [Anaerolineales bacterium]|nr:hypothetical protein [Anaerolineales bacterium]